MLTDPLCLLPNDEAEILAQLDRLVRAANTARQFEDLGSMKAALDTAWAAAATAMSLIPDAERRARDAAKLELA